MTVSRDEVDTCIRVLDAARSDELTPELSDKLHHAIANAHRAVKKRRKARRATARREHDEALLATSRTFVQEIPGTDPPSPPAGSAGTAARSEPAPTLRRYRICYGCKIPYRRVDPRYHQMCPDCAELNAARRQARCDLRGRRAVVTGGRVKIGFYTALKLLRDGAEVVVTTRFPRDAARRYASVADFAEWAGRLHIHGVDLLDLPGVLDLLSLLRDRGPLDILVNNAAQTLHRPAAYHREVRAAEREPLTGPAASVALSCSGTATSTRSAAAPARDVPRVAGIGPRQQEESTIDAPASDGTTGVRAGSLDGIEALFPAGMLDETGQPLDLRPVNSWMLRDAEVTPREWLQVHVVNAFVPFLLTSRLRPQLELSSHPDRYVVQVSAMEGSYSKPHKTPRHPHTNMAKAALNMLTRTVAEDYRRSGISVNSVDTGWVTDERPHPARRRDAEFRPPLDVVDGAARVYDPVIRGVRGEPVYGEFLKDYRSARW